MEHSFDIDTAKEYGILEAVIIRNFQYWIAKNKANETHFIEGRYWTYNSVSALQELFPYASPKQIRKAIDDLVEKGVLIKGNHSDKPTDRTTWFAFANEEMWLVQKGQMDLPYRANGIAPEGKCIINTDSKHTDKEIKKIQKEKRNPDEDIPKAFEDAWEAYGRKGSKRNALKRWMALSDADREKAMVHIPFYIKSNERQYLKDFEGYLNQHTFDNVVSDKKGNILFDPERKVDGKYRPSEGGMISWSKSHGMYLFTGPNERMVFDGYDDTDRPDGAELVFNNGRGVYAWSAEQRKWIRKQE